jgi:hypothetical protein
LRYFSGIQVGTDLQNKTEFKMEFKNRKQKIENEKEKEKEKKQGKIPLTFFLFFHFLSINYFLRFEKLKYFEI